MTLQREETGNDGQGHTWQEAAHRDRFIKSANCCLEEPLRRMLIRVTLLLC